MIILDVRFTPYQIQYLQNEQMSNYAVRCQNYEFAQLLWQLCD